MMMRILGLSKTKCSFLLSFFLSVLQYLPQAVVQSLARLWTFCSIFLHNVNRCLSHLPVWALCVVLDSTSAEDPIANCLFQHESLSFSPRSSSSISPSSVHPYRPPFYLNPITHQSVIFNDHRIALPQS